jgi:hypothetical protein
MKKYQTNKKSNSPTTKQAQYYHSLAGCITNELRKAADVGHPKTRNVLKEINHIHTVKSFISTY